MRERVGQWLCLTSLLLVSTFDVGVALTSSGKHPPKEKAQQQHEPPAHQQRTRAELDAHKKVVADLAKKRGKKREEWLAEHAKQKDDKGTPQLAYDWRKQTQEEQVDESSNANAAHAQPSKRNRNPDLGDAHVRKVIENKGKEQRMARALKDEDQKDEDEDRDDKDDKDDEDDLEFSGPVMSKEMSDTSLRLAIQVGTAASANTTTNPSRQPAYFFICGSALGVYRDGMNPDGDDDIDVAIPVEMLPDVSAAFKQLNQAFRSSSQHWGVFAPDSHVSFWGYRMSDDGQYLCFGCDPPNCQYRDAYPASMMLPARRIESPNVTGDAFPFLPRDPASYLALRYGRSWMVPKAHDEPGAKATFASVNQRYDEHCVTKT